MNSKVTDATSAVATTTYPRIDRYFNPGNGRSRLITASDMTRFELRFKVDQKSQCWIWTDSRTVCGYGRFSFRDRKVRAHRFAYVAYRSPIPGGLVLDHLCRNRACVNPEHLEPVTLAENVRRGASGTSESDRCRYGHPRTPENASPNGKYISCKICRAESARRSTARQRGEEAPLAAARTEDIIRPLYYSLGARPTLSQVMAALRAAGLKGAVTTASHARKRLEAAEPSLRDFPEQSTAKRPSATATQCGNGHPYEGDNAGRQGRECITCSRLRYAKKVGKDIADVGKPKTHCKSGHPFDDENTFIDARGARQCRTCRKASDARAAARNAARDAGDLR